MSRGRSASSNTFLGLARDQTPWATARAVVLPVPLDTDPEAGLDLARGPAAVLAASTDLEPYDEELDRETADLHTAKPLDFSGVDPEIAVKTVANASERWLARGKFLLALGGEQTLTLGTTLAQVRQGREFGVLHLGARPNLNPDYQGRVFGPSCVGARLVEAGFSLTGLGWRSLSRAESRAMDDERIQPFLLKNLDLGGDWIGPVTDRLPDPVYLSMDLNVLDPSVMPDVAHPSPGGLTWRELTAFLARLFSVKRVIGVDVVHYRPGSGPAALVAAKLVHRLLGLALPPLSPVSGGRGSP
jgi:agmatinase